MDGFFCNEPPERKAAIGYHVHTVKPGRPTVARLLGQVTGCYTHFVETDRGKRTRPCYPPLGCPYCGRFRRRWNGYMPALIKVTESEGVRWIRRTLHISELAFESLRGKELRGMLLQLWRKDARPNSELVLRIDEPAHEIKGLPVAWDVRPILLSLFDVAGVDDERRDILPWQEVPA